MKKILFLLMIPVYIISCRDLGGSSDNAGIEKDSLAKVVGIDKDENGCVTSAGYKWSILKKTCIRPFEDGIRLNPSTEIKAGDPVISAFAVLDEDGNKAELFLPNYKSSIIMERKSERNPYIKDEWQLLTDKGYTLKKGDSVMYAGAMINEEVITGSDNPED
jgi:hypothetical protein